MLGTQRFERETNFGGQRMARQGQSGRTGEFKSTGEGLFKGIRAAFLTRDRSEDQLIDLFREHGGRVLDLEKLDETNYNQALRWCDYLIVSDSKLDQKAMERMAKQLKVPKGEFSNILQQAAQGRGLSVVSPNWLFDSLQDDRLLDDSYYSINLKGSRGGLGQDYEDEELGNEDTAYTNKFRGRTPRNDNEGRQGGRGGSREHIGHGRFTEGMNYDDIREEDLDENDEDDQIKLTQIKKSKNLRRIGTKSPYRNKDGSLDRRRVRGNQDEDDQDIEDLNPEDFPDEYRNKDGSLDRRRVRPGNQKRGSSKTRGFSSGRQGGGGGRGRHLDDDVSDLDPNEFPDEYRNKDGSLDRRRVRPNNTKKGQGGGQGGQRRNQDEDFDEEDFDNLGQEFRNKDGSLDKRRLIPMMARRQAGKGGSQNRESFGGQQRRGSRQSKDRRQDNQDEDVDDLNPNEFPEEYRNKDGSLDRRRVRPLNKRRGQSSGGSGNQGGNRGGNRGRGGDDEMEEFGQRFGDEFRNKDGSLDKRRVVPRMLQGQNKGQSRGRNQDDNDDDQGLRNRQRTGASGQQRQSSQGFGQNRRRQGGSKQRDDTIFNKDGTEDLRHYGPFNVDRAPTGQFVRKGAIRDPIESFERDSKSKTGGTRGGSNRRRGGREDIDEDDEGFDSGPQGNKRRGQSHGGGRMNQSSRQGRQSKGRDEGLLRNKDGSIDKRQFAPFNVDRAPTGQLVPKGSIKDPIQSYGDSKQKFRQGGFDDEDDQRRGGGRQNNRRRTRDTDQDEDEDFNQGGRRQGGRRSSQKRGGQRDDEMVNRDGTEDLRKYGPFNVDRAPTGQFVPKGSIRDPIDQYPDSKTKQRRGRDEDDEDQDSDNRQRRSGGQGGQRRSMGRSMGRSQGRGGNRDDEMINKNGSEDLRKYGPFNVDRAPTGQFVPKGSIRDPIEQYPDSKTKLRRGRNDDDEDDDNDIRGNQRRGSQGGQRSGGQGGQRRSMGRSHNRGGNRDDEMVNKDGSEDLRKYGPFNVDRAPTGQFVPKGAIRDPIDQYPDSKTKLRKNRDDDDDDDIDDDDRRGKQRRGEQRSGGQGGQRRSIGRNRGNERDDEMVNKDGSEDLRKYGPFNVDRAPTGQFVPKGSIRDPIDKYPDSKTKMRQGGENNEQENKQGGRQSKGRGGNNQKRRYESMENDNRRRTQDTEADEDEGSQRQNNKKKPINQEIINQLQKVRDHYNDLNDQGRKIAYNKAIGFLRNLDKPIEDADSLDELPTIGQNIKEHIKEYLETGKIQLLEQGGSDNQDQITKDDMEDFIDTLRKTCESTLEDLKDNLRIDPMGQSRKGQNLKELDLRLMRKDGKEVSQDMLEKIMSELENNKLLSEKEDIQKEGDGSLKCSGLCNLNDKQIPLTLTFAQEQNDF